MTVNDSYFGGIITWKKIAEQTNQPAYVVYGGNEMQERTHAYVVSWDRTKEIIDSTNL
jgi:hypothetical protein